ncbi:MAG: response regulator transcription factor, partial [Actinomycetota bacterium]|nr:response regulator transcription factor [Actinomycetota bacterium]
RGDDLGAGRAATELGFDHAVFRLELAVANGWFQRAHRLLDGLDPVAEQVWLGLREAELSYHTAGDMAYTRELAAAARKLAADLALLDAEMMALALEGLALVGLGEVDEGLRRLDEATVAAVGGELERYKAINAICCFMIFACERVRDIERASQWCEHYMAYCQHNDMPGYLAFCRVHHASVLAARGRWAAAEKELERAREELQARPAWSLPVFERLGELRRRQGRFDEAAALFKSGQPHPGGILGAGRLALDQGDPDTALELAEGMLEPVPQRDRVERLAALELLVRSRCARGEPAAGEEAVAELEAVAEIAGTECLMAMASHGRGQLALAAGDADAARQPLQLALDSYVRARLPFESALVRLDVARALHALGRHESALEQARTAGETFDGLGATVEAGKVRAMMAELSDTGHSAAHGVLTPREAEVLRLLAGGASNQEIADELVVSRHTVRRHVSNLLAKLGVDSRTAAAAWAHEHDLV